MKKILFTLLPQPFYDLFKKWYFYPQYVKEYLQFKKALGTDTRFNITWKNRYPCLYDRTATTGFDRHYIYHPAWAARILAQVKPKLHVDIASSLSFSSIVSAFIPVDFYDIRPAELVLSNLGQKSADLQHLPFPDNSLESVSCLHTLEHVGLGRYGDTMDPNGDLKAISELKRVLAPGGCLLIVVPVGKPKIQFNAHRIYSLQQIKSYFSELTLVEFTLIPEKSGAPKKNATQEEVANEDYGCGCFWFTKK